MIQRLHKPRWAFRCAVSASVLIHLAIVTAFFVVSLQGQEEKTSRPLLDTRIEMLTFDPEPGHTVVVPPDPAQPSSTPPEATPATALQSQTDQSTPLDASNTKNHLRSEDNGAVVNSGSGHSIQQAHAVSSAPAQPLHGGMRPGQLVVYLVDCSGSMGEYGKLERVKSVLMSTLRCQPDGVRLQVICYNSKSWPLWPGEVSINSAVGESAEMKLKSLMPAGRSHHADALRMGVDLHPDAIVWLTDADDVAWLQLKPILRSAIRPVPVYRAAVLADRIESPRLLP